MPIEAVIAFVLLDLFAVIAGWNAGRRSGFEMGLLEGREIERLRWLSMDEATRRQKRQDHREALRLETERRTLAQYAENKITTIERSSRRLRRRKG